MEIKEFVKAALTEIITGAEEASNEKIKFVLDSGTSKGVHFNLAVVNVETNQDRSGSSLSGGIKIASAEYGKSTEKSTSSENISRIEFNIKHRDLAYENELARTVSKMQQKAINGEL